MYEWIWSGILLFLLFILVLLKDFNFGAIPVENWLPMFRIPGISARPLSWGAVQFILDI
jgi:hypothetical protein